MSTSRAATDALRPTAALLGAHVAVEATIERLAVEPTGLDPTTCDLLMRISLSPNGQLRAVDLCQQLQLSPSHMSRRLDRAISGGLVERSADPEDRRAHNITLTPAGETAVLAFRPLLVGVVEQVVFDTLTAAEVATLVDLLNRVESAAQSLNS